MTAEVYPNDYQARIVRCSGHPELAVRWGGHIEETIDNKTNSVYHGFFQTVDMIPFNQTPEDEYTYNYCILRRSIAWITKIPDHDLPPVYGPSQVCDLSPYHQLLTLTLEGTTELDDQGVFSLDLYYRYSNDNTTWNNWTFYGTDTDGTNGWFWDFHAPEGLGYYQFYSLRHVKYEYEWQNETAPPGPDATAYLS